MTNSLNGVWLGTLTAGTQNLRIQLHIEDDFNGQPKGTLDSIDQKAFGIPLSNLRIQDAAVSFDIPAVRGSWTGQFSAEGQSLVGTWKQSVSLPLTMERQATAIPPTEAALPDPALPPVALADLKAVLDRDLAAAIESGVLAPTTNVGITIGVVHHGERRIITYGTAKPDSVFEIGSVTKTFTGLILAQMAAQGTVSLNDPVRELLPPGTVARPSSGREITLLDLSDQHSGLPRMPDNFHPADRANPYVDYDAKLLYAFIAKHGVELPPNAPFGYSNLAVGLLGRALANKAALTYSELLEQQITVPLGLKNTAVELTPAMKANCIQGHGANHQPVKGWDLDALAGAGAIRSDAADMLTYLEAQLHPNHLPVAASSTPAGKTLSAAIRESQVIRADAGEGRQIALNWLYIDADGSYWHNGATGGYSAFALFNTEKDFAVVVLSNITVGPDLITDKLGMHIVQRLSGLEAISLAP
jgi:CubicO group peptidase (beta-lactamase class C family)